MSNRDNPDDFRELQQAVRDTAYFLWENAGRPEGRSDEFWFEALEIHLRSRAYNHWLHNQSVVPENAPGSERTREPFGDLGRTGLNEDEAEHLAEDIEEERDA